MIQNRKRFGSVKVSLLAAMVAMAAGTAFAADKKPEGQGASAAVANPYSPAAGHAYRHGVIPTRDTQKLMRNWDLTHPSVAATGTNTLMYGGGTSSSSQGSVGVMNGQVKVYLVFFGSGWGTQTTDANGDAKFSGDPNGAASAAQEMFKGIGTGNELWSAELTQWCQGISSGSSSCPSSTPASSFIPYQSGGILAGVWEDTSATTPVNATGARLAQEAIKAAQHFGNTTAASNRYSYYVIMSAHNDNPDNYQSTTSGYCAWHDWNGDSSLTGGAVSSSVGDLAFSNQPYNMDVGANCGVGFVNSPGTLDGWTMTLGHEWHEMMSDTFPAGGWTASSGQENSDECAWISPGSTGGAANVAFGTGTFAEQASWSNDTNSCAISHPIVSHGSGGTPTANFTFTTSGLTANFTDTSTDSGGSISAHSWNFGDSSTSTATNPSHTYAAGGTYSVTETVTDSVSGKTSSKTQSVSVASTGGTPTANFTFTTSGLTANFTDTSTDSGGTIGSHSWNFGDSTTSTATNPSHTYSASGSYSVTETVTDSVSGKTSSKTSTVSVSNVTSSQILLNTSLESTASWASTAGVLCPTGCSGESAHSGSGFAWLDGYGSSHTDTLSQTVTIPAGVTSGTLQFYLHIDTAETTTSTAYDKLTVQVGSTTLATFSNLNAASGYAVHSYNFTVTPGASLTVKFTGTEDVSLQTSFVIDDVTLTVH